MTHLGVRWLDTALMLYPVANHSPHNPSPEKTAHQKQPILTACTQISPCIFAETQATTQTAKPNIAFKYNKQRALIGDQYKIHSKRNGESWQLYDLLKDEAETTDISKTQPEITAKMIKEWGKWDALCEASNAGKDYPEH